jgi:hypothetical protein
LKNKLVTIFVGSGVVSKGFEPKIGLKPFSSVDFASIFVKEVRENFE